jgi:hypothetical protein
MTHEHMAKCIAKWGASRSDAEKLAYWHAVPFDDALRAAVRSERKRRKRDARRHSLRVADGQEA